MECNVVKDLIPLYIDNCCSEESVKLVKEHIESCQSCKALYESMKTPAMAAPAAPAPKKLTRINDWKASILQSVLLFASFAIITVGVALEAATPSGLANGYWALTLVIPATGFLLSLANWYFVRLYKSRKSFSNCSLLATIGAMLCAYVWAGFHYQFNYLEPLTGRSFLEFFEVLFAMIRLFGIGIILIVVFCVLSKVLSGKYAAMLGKE